ncbi:pre-rRNA processing and 40S ribosomal subunit assembly [Emydomyces testavorans]|uniref:Pre-rRNA processing and 40S ribosomal subunit assembly n=1 Tax=Emydomyces testavorans TaxID=2070801 RepID=A0AAF0DE20_9EURO|nr:pre-rRNA processing and 40S ribosomal subunit assembly [Emydomyces testavorans]
MLGKRKREATVVSRSAEPKEDPLTVPPDSHDLLRKYFEARFEPLETQPQKEVSAADFIDIVSEDDSSVSEWNGISDDDEDSAQALKATPEVIDHSTPYTSTKDDCEKELRKQFMSAKPPSSSQLKNISKTKTKSAAVDDEEANEVMNLKNDLALQRLLKESHLLESAHDLNPTGKNRHRAIDIRMQSIGAADSIYTQKNMPMSHKRGIEAKAAKKEETRRREARENGIILEKSAPKREPSRNGRRERGIGGPLVGKFAGGTLKLSKRDVIDIQGPRRMVKGKKKGRA